MNTKKFKNLVKKLILGIGINPSYKLDYINSLLKFGNWMKSVEIPRKFENREALYEFLNNELIKNRPIVFLEFGVAQGVTLERWLLTNTNPDSMFYGFDTFRGLPEDAKHFIKVTPKGTFDLDGKPPDINDSRAEFVVGLFQETLVDFIAGELMRQPDQRLVVHLDADLFSASLFVLSTLDPIMRPGTVIIINNFNSVLGTFRAFSDYIEAFQRDYTILGVTDPSYNRVALEVV